jgi:hypothetical protein
MHSEARCRRRRTSLSNGARAKIGSRHGENFDRNLALVDKAKAIAAEKGITPSQLALAWVMAQGEHIVPIPGTKRRKYLEDNAGAADVHLAAENLAEISAAFPPDQAAVIRKMLLLRLCRLYPLKLILKILRKSFAGLAKLVADIDLFAVYQRDVGTPVVNELGTSVKRDRFPQEGQLFRVLINEPLALTKKALSATCHGFRIALLDKPRLPIVCGIFVTRC